MNDLSERLRAARHDPELEDWKALSRLTDVADEAADEIERLRAEVERLRKDAIAALSDGGVLVRLHRPEYCEDVHPEIVASDALWGNWGSWDVLTEPQATEARKGEGE
jgi:hypothetical protein